MRVEKLSNPKSRKKVCREPPGAQKLRTAASKGREDADVQLLSNLREMTCGVQKSEILKQQKVQKVSKKMVQFSDPVLANISAKCP